MVVTLFALVLSFIPILSNLLALVAWSMSSIILHIIHWFAALPQAEVNIIFSRALSIISLGLIIVISFLWLSKHQEKQKER